MRPLAFGLLIEVRALRRKLKLERVEFALLAKFRETSIIMNVVKPSRVPVIDRLSSLPNALINLRQNSTALRDRVLPRLLIFRPQAVDVVPCMHSPSPV